MIFTTLFSSLLSALKPSLQSFNLNNSLLNLTTSLQSQRVNEIPGIGQMFEGHSLALSNGIKPVPTLFRNKWIHSRVKSQEEMIINIQKELDLTKKELELVQSLRMQQRNATGIVKKTFASERTILKEEHAKEFQNIAEQVKHWQDIVDEHEEKLLKMGEDMLTLRDAATTSARSAEAIKTERDETRAQLELEKELADETKERCAESLSSIRQNSEHEKELLKRKGQALRETVRIMDRKIGELNDFCEGCMKDMEAKDSQIALHERGEVIDSYSRSISGIVGEMSEVVGPVGLNDWQNLGERIQVLLDGMRGLVSEVKRLRDHSRAASLRMYWLKEERLETEQSQIPPFDMGTYMDFASEFGGEM